MEFKTAVVHHLFLKRCLSYALCLIDFLRIEVPYQHAKVSLYVSADSASYHYV
ncbi:MAG TPA: hypothetical protein VD884_12605 [Ohtaekwangia sp.]|nr:hypothetical protein [Ohtaekwangia sp.]